MIFKLSFALVCAHLPGGFFLMSLNTFGPIVVVVDRRRRPRKIGSNDDFIGIDHWYHAQNTTSSDPRHTLSGNFRSFQDAV